MTTSPDTQTHKTPTHGPASCTLPNSPLPNSAAPDRALTESPAPGNSKTGPSIELPPPATYRAKQPLTVEESARVDDHRNAIGTILHGRGERLLAIVGPCSIHSVDQALDYADQLSAAQTRFKDTLLIAMRVYIEKPRTTVGWRGLALDPSLDASSGPELGLLESRRVMKGVIERGLPVATESLDPLIVPYVEDMLAFSSLGARTSESQTHRQMAAAMACPVGIKNATCGSLAVAADAAVAVQTSQPVFRLTTEGSVAFEEVHGNPNTAIVLRGGAQGPNYAVEHQLEAKQLVHQRGIEAGVIVDCSHGNSGKVASRQAEVIDYISSQLYSDENSPVGVMIESNLHGGKQAAGRLQTLQYGVSVTDECMSFDDTLRCLEKLADAVHSKTTRAENSLATA